MMRYKVLQLLQQRGDLSCTSSLVRIVVLKRKGVFSGAGMKSEVRSTGKYLMSIHLE
jgi:hypothetical protein